MNVTLVFTPPVLLNLQSAPGRVVAKFQWFEGSRPTEVSEVTVTRSSRGYHRVDAGRSGPPPRTFSSSGSLHWEYETAAIKEYVDAIAAL